VLMRRGASNARLSYGWRLSEMYGVAPPCMFQAGYCAISFTKIHVKIHTDSTVDYSKQPKRESHHFRKPAACTNGNLCRVFSRHVCCRRHLCCGYSRVTASSTAQCLRLYWSASAMTLTSSAATLRRKLVWWMRLERPVLWCSQFPR